MKYRHLGDSGLEVSEVGSGANNFGEPGKLNQKSSVEIIHTALDHGVNLIDTSNVYG